MFQYPTIIRLSERNLEVLLLHPRLLYEFLGFPPGARYALPPRRLLARLFGRHATLPDPRRSRDDLIGVMDYSFFHSFLIDTVGQGNEPLGFLEEGGSTFDGPGIGSVRAFTSAQVDAIATALHKVEFEALHRYGKRQRPVQHPDDLGFTVNESSDLWTSFERMRQFLTEAQGRRQALLAGHWREPTD